MSAQLAMFGINALMGLGNGYLAKEQVKAQNVINAADAYAANLMRGANNELAAKRTSLARYVQTEQNKKIMDAAGDVAEANTVNYLRSRDDLDNADVESQIRFMEQAGSQAAAAAASGLTGGAADLVAGTLALREGRRQAQMDRVRGQVKVDFGEAQRRQFAETMSRTNNEDIITDIDYSINTYSPMRRSGNVLTDIFGGQSSDSIKAAATATSKFFKF